MGSGKRKDRGHGPEHDEDESLGGDAFLQARGPFRGHAGDDIDSSVARCMHDDYRTFEAPRDPTGAQALRNPSCHHEFSGYRFR